MPDAPAQPWPEDEAPAPEPTAIPAGWAAPTPASPAPPAPAPSAEDQALARGRFSRKRRFWITTVVYIVVWVAAVQFIDTGGNPFVLLWAVVPLYLLTLPFALKTPKRFKGQLPKGPDRLDLAFKVMVALAIFLAAYVPFTFASNEFIPFAPQVEYVTFALLLFLLFRLAGRSAGVAPSPAALPPPTHRLHQQVVAPIDDVHYQRTLWLNYQFVERGRGARQLAKRIDEILEDNGLDPERRRGILQPLEAEADEGGFQFGRRSRERRAAGRDGRARLLDDLFGRIQRDLEQSA